MSNFTHLHLHSDHSLLDSCTKFNSYVDRAVEYGMKAIACTEHGVITNWTDKLAYCEKMGIKFIHGCEFYLTVKEYFDIDGKRVKVRDNYHTVLLAKNYEGVKEINTLVSIASKRGDMYYYKPRITFDMFLNTSDNVIRLSACVAGVLARIDRDIIYLEDSEEDLDIARRKALIEYRDSMFDKYDYYEVQPHYFPRQFEVNRMLANEAKKRNKKLVATNDVHSLDNYKAECRNILMKAKGISFNEEDGEFDCDLTFKSYDEMVDAFEKQGVLTKEEYTEALNSTNEIADMIQDYNIDRSIKYPKISDNDSEIFFNKLEKMFKYKVESGIIPEEQVPEFEKRIKEEVEVFKKVDMITFMLSMSDIICWCKDNNIPIGPARGSVGGSCVAYVMDITDLNPVKWKTVFSRFCNEFRVEIGD